MINIIFQRLIKTTVVLIALFVGAQPSVASPATEAPIDMKGSFGEDFFQDFWSKTGRKPLLKKSLTTTHGPDQIYRLADGSVEVHEVKAYSGWAGTSAMKTTINGGKTEVFELSSNWINYWIEQSESPTASEEMRNAAREVRNAIKNGRISFRLDSMNLAEEKFTCYKVRQVSREGVALEELIGKQSVERFSRRFLEHQKKFAAQKAARFMGRPQLLEMTRKSGAGVAVSSMTEKELLSEVSPILGEQTPTTVVKCAGAITNDGRLLVSLKSGATAGLGVFAFEAGVATYEFYKGNLWTADYKRKLEDAAIKGASVGSCVGVAVYLGAVPGGWVVLAVGFTTYLVVDYALTLWNESRNQRYLSIDDLRGFGIISDTPLDPDMNATTLKMRSDSPMDIPADSPLSL